jgi:hypothetical protein
VLAVSPTTTPSNREHSMLTKAHLQDPVQLTDLESIFRGSLSLSRV